MKTLTRWNYKKSFLNLSSKGTTFSLDWSTLLENTMNACETSATTEQKWRGTISSMPNSSLPRSSSNSLNRCSALGNQPVTQSSRLTVTSIKDATTSSTTSPKSCFQWVTSSCGKLSAPGSRKDCRLSRRDISQRVSRNWVMINN